MSASQSNLAAPKYGYDLVLAITQASINLTMKKYLSALKEPEVVICYVADEQGKPTRVEYSELKIRANGSDPFSVPDGADPNKNQDLKNLLGARFMVGFKARIGLPPGLPPSEIPDIVTLGDNTSRVSFNLMCSEFIVVQLTPPSGYSPASWLNKSQPSGHPWLFNTAADLRLAPADKSAYDKLPPDVQKQIKNLGNNAFSVQQLIFVLANAGLEPIPTISGVDPSSTLYLVLEKYFVNEYFLKLKEHGQPVLGAAVLPDGAGTSAILPTDLNYQIMPFLDVNGQPVKNPSKEQQRLSTLNYLLSTDGHKLPDATPFTWNWLDQPSEQLEYHGVMAMKADTFWNHLLNELKQKHIRPLCLKPYVKVHWNEETQRYQEDWRFDPEPNLSLPENSKPGAPYYFKYAPPKVSDYDQNHWYADKSWLIIELTYEFSLKFDIPTKIISINQHLTVYLYNGFASGNNYDGNIIDRTIDTNYKLTIDEHGMIIPHATSKIDEGSASTPDYRVNTASAIAKVISNQAQVLAAHNYQPPLVAFQNIIFPGGNTFGFSKVGFSDHLDLIAHVIYPDPR